MLESMPSVFVMQKVIGDTLHVYMQQLDGVFLVQIREGNARPRLATSVIFFGLKGKLQDEVHFTDEMRVCQRQQRLRRNQDEGKRLSDLTYIRILHFLACPLLLFSFRPFGHALPVKSLCDSLNPGAVG